MVNRLLQLFGSYDFFGKAIPGAALLLGVWSLLPPSVLQISSSSGEFRLVNLLAFLVVLLSLGLMIGQGVHTLADNAEKIFRWMLVRIVDLRQLLGFYDIEVDLNYLKPDEPDETVIGVDTFWHDWHSASIEWLRGRFWGTFDSFVSHRYLFSKWFQWNYDKERDRAFDNRWNPGDKDILMEPFCEAYKEVFEDDIRQYTIKEVETIYPLITAYVSRSGSNEYRQFQAIYSFCRSMWAVLFILTIAYSVVLYQPFGDLGLLTEPSRIGKLPSSITHLFPVIIFITGMIFVDAAGTYKKHFVEYLIVSFATSRIADEEQTDQSTLQQYYS